MSVVSDNEDEQTRGSRLARWAADHDLASPSPGWLLGERNVGSDDIASLKQRLADAERRAADAEEALPHLLGLGQRTVNGLLSDARARGREIIEEARQQAALEVEAERRAVAREAAELDALRMAVAAEAMGLEQIRKELEAGVAALQLGSGDPTRVQPAIGPGYSGVERRVAAPSSVAADPAASLLPPPPSLSDLATVGMSAAVTPAPKDSPSTRFAEAWAAGEDELMVEAFDRFFAGEIERDPLRDDVVGETSGRAASS